MLHVLTLDYELTTLRPELTLSLHIGDSSYTEFCDDPNPSAYLPHVWGEVGMPVIAHGESHWCGVQGPCPWWGDPMWTPLETVYRSRTCVPVLTMRHVH